MHGQELFVISIFPKLTRSPLLQCGGVIYFPPGFKPPHTRQFACMHHLQRLWKSSLPQQTLDYEATTETAQSTTGSMEAKSPGARR